MYDVIEAIAKAIHRLAREVEADRDRVVTCPIVGSNLTIEGIRP